MRDELEASFDSYRSMSGDDGEQQREYYEKAKSRLPKWASVTETRWMQGRMAAKGAG